MRALKLDHAPTSEPRRSLRHRSASAPIPASERPTRAFDDDDRDAASMIALLADALEQIASTSTDGASREIAEDAIALFQGR
jgi:hypothetical protein